jgi:uncharacterized protein
MSISDPRSGLDRLTHEECMALLAGDEIGRLAVIDFGAPLVFPVNYALDGEHIVMRTDPGTKLDRGVPSRACFEIDAFDRATRSGWSVIASGRLEEVTRFDPAFRHLSDLEVTPWAAGDKHHWLRLVPERVTGRRLTVGTRG